MESIYKKYKDGEISRKEVYKKASEILNLSSEDVRFVYESYFKPSQEECLENPTEACETGNYMLQEEDKFGEFVFYIAKKNEEKIREIQELAKQNK